MTKRTTRTAEEPGIGGWLRRNAQFGSVLSALSIEGVLATMSIEDATDGAIFAAYLEQVLLPVLRERKPDAVLVMDNLRPHKTPEGSARPVRLYLSLFARLAPGPQPDRTRLGQDESLSAPDHRAHCRGAATDACSRPR